MTLSLQAVAAAASLVLTGGEAAAQHYIPVGIPNASLAYDLNNNNQVLLLPPPGTNGFSVVTLDAQGAIIATVPFGPLSAGGPLFAFRRINDLGDAVGLNIYQVSPFPNECFTNRCAYRTHLGSSGVLTSFTNSAPVGIDNAGRYWGNGHALTGCAAGSNPNFPFTAIESSSTPIGGTPPGADMSLSGILGCNNINQAVGRAFISGGMKAIMWDQSWYVIANAAGGAPGMTDAFAINDVNQVVGYSQGSQVTPLLWTDVNVDHAVDAGELQTLSVPPGFAAINGPSIRINNLGHIVASSIAFQPVLWRGTTTGVTLNSVLVPGSGWNISQVTDINDSDWILAFGQPSPTAPNQPVILIPTDDMDGDGLLDDWETNGIPYTDVNGTSQRYLLDLDGNHISDADPLHKDLFIEADAMIGLMPPEAAMAMVKNTFASVPNSLVGNLDGLPGIALHVLRDEGSIPLAGWTLDDTNGNGTDDWPNEFDALKSSAGSGTTLNGYFGTVAERNDPSASGIREAKSKAFRYCIFAKEQDPGDSTSGRAELPGNDFMVTLGLWADGAGGFGGTLKQQAGTFMHELGHALNLQHGGGDSINYKPNYYSVMNYSWQMPHGWQTAGSWPLDPGRFGYSSFALPSLNEAALNECAAMVAPGSALAGIRYPINVRNDPFAGFPCSSAPAPELIYGRMHEPTDWNFDLAPQCAPDSSAVDANRLRGSLCPSPGETLVSHADWPAVTLGFRNLPSFAPGVHNPGAGDALEELDAIENQAIENMLPRFCQGDVNNSASVDVTDLLSVINHWGACPANATCPADIAPAAPDGAVNVIDLLAVINNWGPCP